MLKVHGAAQEEHWEVFLSDSASLGSQNRDPYIIGGDFNILRYVDEKNKVFHQKRYSDFLTQITHAISLRDFFSGGKYAWSNNQSNPTMMSDLSCLTAIGMFLKYLGYLRWHVMD
jgi:hypothetical protein